MQFPKVNKLLLIFAPSINLIPLLLVAEALSLPARSIRLNLLNLISTSIPLFLSLYSIDTCKIACDLDDVSFAPVASCVLFLFPLFNIFNISLLLFIFISVIPLTIIPFSGSSLKSKYSLEVIFISVLSKLLLLIFLPINLSKSLIFSL